MQVLRNFQSIFLIANSIIKGKSLYQTSKTINNDIFTSLLMINYADK